MLQVLQVLPNYTYTFCHALDTFCAFKILQTKYGQMRGSQRSPIPRRSSFYKAFLAPSLVLPSPSPLCAPWSAAANLTPNPLRKRPPEVLPVLVHQQQHVSAPICPHLSTSARLPNRNLCQKTSPPYRQHPHMVGPCGWVIAT